MPYRCKGFNHGTIEVEYHGHTKPKAQALIDCAQESVNSKSLYFTVTQSHIDHTFSSWHRNGYSSYNLAVMRHDGRSYLHG